MDRESPWLTHFRGTVIAIMRRTVFLLLMAACCNGCLLPESSVVESESKNAAPASVRGDKTPLPNDDAAADAADNEERDAGQRVDAGQQSSCESVQADAGESKQGACCDAPATCYDGPSGTLAVGLCEAGMRPCASGKYGACEGSVVPRGEACDNPGSDDDCDGDIDNVPSLGNPCTPDQNTNACGNGKLVCVAGMDALQCVVDQPPAELCNQEDDDCDDKVDEAYDLMADAMHCGACGHPCGARETCCQGKCVDTRSDEANCGTCGTTCDMGTAPTCCASACVDIASDRRHCGQCGNDCGVACTCESNEGAGECRGALGVCF